jgi:hypothetical protein
VMLLPFLVLIYVGMLVARHLSRKARES